MKSQAINQAYLSAALAAAATRTYRAAARLGLAREEREDLQQELLLDLMERAPGFDPERASANTYTGVVSEHRTGELLAARTKDRARLCFFSGTRKASNDEHADGSSQDYGDNVVPMWAEDYDLFSDSAALLDLQKAIAFMTDEQAALYHLLESHQDLPDACKASGVSSATFYRRVEQLQMHLRMFGFSSAA